MKYIFINEKEVSFSRHPSTKENCLNIIPQNIDILSEIYQLCSGNALKNIETIRLVSEKPSHTFKSFKKKFPTIRAAGGIVLNEKKQILMIERLGKWDLPKGKIEKEEKKKIAALREVEEECSVRELSIVQKKKKTYHMYEMKNTPVLKVTHWYEMLYYGVGTPKPQTEEGITQTKWADQDFVKTVIKENKTYKNIALILSEYL